MFGALAGMPLANWDAIPKYGIKNSILWNYDIGYGQ
jgi:hypothetical protein